jgi:pimeloyl-ACP methyl ester carboxylesterase
MIADMTRVDEKFVPVPDGEIFTRTWEIDSENVPIILLHDSLGSVDLWGSFPSALAQETNRTVVAYDRLGFGRSSARSEPPSSNFIVDEADIYFPLIKGALGFSDFCLFGHSVGGGMSIAIATRFQDECRAVISESAQAFIEDITLEGIRTAKKRFENPKAFEKLKRLHGEKAKWVLDAWTETWLSGEFADWSLRDALPEVLCPLLIIHGDRDEFGSRAFPEMLRDYAGGEVRMEILDDTGHIPHREKPEVVLDLVRAFLSTRE